MPYVRYPACLFAAELVVSVVSEHLWQIPQIAPSAIIIVILQDRGEKSSRAGPVKRPVPEFFLGLHISALSPHMSSFSPLFCRFLGLSCGLAGGTFPLAPTIPPPPPLLAAVSCCPRPPRAVEKIHRLPPHLLHQFWSSGVANLSRGRLAAAAAMDPPRSFAGGSGCSGRD